jgi:hypothetical protein
MEVDEVLDDTEQVIDQNQEQNDDLDDTNQSSSSASSSSSSSSSYDISVAEFIRLLQSEGEELLSGLKRCRDAIARGGGNSRDLDEAAILRQEQERRKMDPIAASRVPLGGRMLVSAYLKTSPDAKEMTAVWDALGKNNAGRAASLVADLAGAIIAFASDETQATTFARSVIKARAKHLQAALASSSPRLVRCVLKLMTAAARISPALAREVTRRVPLATKVIDALAITRHDTGLSGGRGNSGGGGISAANSGKHLGILTKKAASSAKRVQSIDALSDPSAIAKHVFIHGRQDDDVRSCFVKYVCALMSSYAPDVVKETVRSKGLVFSILKGLQKDAASVVVEALGSLGDALLLSGSAVPLRTLQDVLNPNAIAMLVGLYSRGAPSRGDGPQVNISMSTSDIGTSAGGGRGGFSSANTAALNAEADIRPALHVFLVAVTTGKLDLGAATIALTTNVNLSSISDSLNAADPSDDVLHQRKRLRLADGVDNVTYGGGDSLRRSTFVRNVPCVFIDNGNGASSSSSALVATAQRSDVASAASNAATAALAAAIGGGSIGVDIDEEDEESRKSLAVIDALTSDKGGSASRARNTNAVASAASKAEGSSDYDIGALAVLLQVKAAEDPLQADLLNRMLAAHPGLIGPYLRAFPFSLEPRASHRWVQNIALFNSVVRSPGSVVRPFVLLRTALVTLSSSTSSSTLSSVTDLSASAVAVGDSDGSVGGIPLVLLARAAIPSAAARSVITRSILHTNPAITFYGLSLLQSILLRLERFISEACELVPFVPGGSSIDSAQTPTLSSLSSSSSSSASAAAVTSTTDVSEHSLSTSIDKKEDRSDLVLVHRARAINEAVQVARASRAAQLARAFAPSLPDILTIVALHARITALCASTSTEKIDLSMSDGAANVDGEEGDDDENENGQGNDKTSSMVISGITISSGKTNTSSSAVRVLPSALGQMLRTRMLSTLNLYVRILPAAALASAGSIVISTPSSGGGGGGGSNGPATFDLLKLAHNISSSSTSSSISPLSSSPSLQNSNGESGTAALLRLFMSTGPPSHADVTERWLSRPKITLVSGSQPSLLVDSNSSTTTTAAAISAAATLASTKAKRLAAEELHSSSSSSSSLPKALRSDSELSLDITAAMQPSVFSNISSFLIADVDSSSSIARSQTQALAIRLIRRCCLASADSTASLRFSVHVSAFRIRPLSSRLFSSSKSSIKNDTSVKDYDSNELAEKPFLRLLTNDLRASNEVDVWINALINSNSRLSNDISKTIAQARLTAFTGLVWATSMDALQSPAVVAVSLPKDSKSNAQRAARSAPFTIRSWMAFCRGVTIMAENMIELMGESQGDEEQSLRLSKALEDLQTALCLEDMSGRDLDGGDGSTIRSGGTQKSAVVTAGAISIVKLLLHTSVAHYLLLATQETLLQLDDSERKSVTTELDRFLTPAYQLLSIMSDPLQSSSTTSTSGSGKKNKKKNKDQVAVSSSSDLPTGPGSELLPYLRPLLSSRSLLVSSTSEDSKNALLIIKASLSTHLPLHKDMEDEENNGNGDDVVDKLTLAPESNEFHLLRASLSAALVKCASISIEALNTALPPALLVCDKVLGGDFSPITEAIYSLPTNATSVFALRPISRALESSGSSKQHDTANTDEEKIDSDAVLAALPENTAIRVFFEKSVVSNENNARELANASSPLPLPTSSSSSVTKSSSKRKRGQDDVPAVAASPAPADDAAKAVVVASASTSTKKKLKKKSLVTKSALRFLESNSLPATLLFDHLVVAGQNGKFLLDAGCRRIAATAFLRQHCVLVPESSLDFGKGGGGLAYLDNGSLQTEEDKDKIVDGENRELTGERNIIALVRIVQSLGTAAEHLVTHTDLSSSSSSHTLNQEDNEQGGEGRIESAAFALNLVSILLELSSGGAGHRISKKAADNMRTISHSSTPPARPDLLATTLRLVLSRSSIQMYFAICLKSAAKSGAKMIEQGAAAGQRSYIDAIASILRAAARPFTHRSSFIRDKAAFAAFEGQTSAALFENTVATYLQQLVDMASPELLLSLKGDSASSLLSLLTAQQQATVLTTLSLSRVIMTTGFENGKKKEKVDDDEEVDEDEKTTRLETFISTVLIPLLTSSSPLTLDDALFRLVSLAASKEATNCPSVDLYRLKVAHAVAAATSIIDNSKSTLISSVLVPSAEKLSLLLINSSSAGGLDMPGAITLLQALSLSFNEVRCSLASFKVSPEQKKGKGMVTVANLITAANASVAGLATGESAPSTAASTSQGGDSKDISPKEVSAIFGLLPALAAQSLIKTSSQATIISPVIALLASIVGVDDSTTKSIDDSTKTSSTATTTVSSSSLAVSGRGILRDAGLTLLQHALFPPSIGSVDAALMDSIYFNRAAVFRALRTTMTPLLLDATTRATTLSSSSSSSSSTDGETSSSSSSREWPLNEHFLSSLEVAVAAALATANSNATGNASAKASKAADRFLVSTSRLVLLSLSNLAARTKKVKKSSRSTTTMILQSASDATMSGDDSTTLPLGLTQALLQRTIFLSLEILSRLGNSWWKAAALDDNKWTTAAGLFTRAVLLPPPVAFVAATASSDENGEVDIDEEGEEVEEEEGDVEEKDEDEDDDDDDVDEEEEEEEIVEGINLASVSGVLSILDAVIGRLSGCGKVLSRDVTTPSAPSVDDVVSAANSFPFQPSTQTLSAFSSLSAFVRHPSFLHLLLRDRYLSVPGLPQGSVASHTTGGYLLDGSNSSNSSSFTVSSLFKPTALVLDLAMRRQKGGSRVAFAASSGGGDISIGLPSTLDSARLASSRLLLRLALLLTPAVVANASMAAETQARRDNRPLWLVAEVNQKSLLVTSFLPLLPVVCAAYTASLSTTDRLLRRILRLFEIGSGQEGESGSSHPARVGFTFSAGAVSHVFWSSKLFGWRAASRALPALPSTTGNAPSYASPSSSSSSSAMEVEDSTLAGKETSASANPQLSTSLEWFFAGEREGQEGAVGGASTGGASSNRNKPGKRRGGFGFAVKSYQRGKGVGGFAGRQRTSAGQRWLAQRAARGASSRVSALRLAASSAPRMFSGPELAGAQTGLLVARVSASLSHFPVHRRFDASDDSIVSLSSSSFDNDGGFDAATTTMSSSGSTEQQQVDSRVVSAGRSSRQELALLSRSRFGDDLSEFAALSSSSSALLSSKSGSGLVGVTAEALHLHTSRERVRASVYDPSFILPALLFVCASGRLASHVKKFASGGALTYALAATTSSDPTVRQAAYAVLGAYVEAASSLPEASAIVKALLGSSAPTAAPSGGPSHRYGGGPGGPHGPHNSNMIRLTPFRELPQVLVLLTCIKNSVKEPFQRLPSLHAAFAAEALHVVLRPAHPLYALINSYLLKKGSLDLDDAPMLYELAGSSSSKTAPKNPSSAAALLASGGGVDSAPRQWLLRVLGRAMRCAADHACMRRRHGYFLLMALATSPQSESEAQAAALSPSGTVGPPGTGLLMRTALGVLLTAAKTRMPKSVFQPQPQQQQQGRLYQQQQTQEEEEDAMDDEVVTATAGVEKGQKRAGGFGDDDVEIEDEDEGEVDDENAEKAKRAAAEAAAKKALDSILTSRRNGDGSKNHSSSSSHHHQNSSHHSPPPASSAQMTQKEMPLSAAAYLRRSCYALPWVASIWARLRASLTLTHSPILLVEARREGLSSSSISASSSAGATAIDSNGSSSSSSSTTTPTSLSSSVRMVVAGSPAPLDVLLASAELMVLLVRSAALPLALTNAFPAGSSASSSSSSSTLKTPSSAVKKEGEIDADTDDSDDEEEEAGEDGENDDEEKEEEEDENDFVLPSTGTSMTTQEMRKREILLSSVAEALSAFSQVLEANALVLERLASQVEQGTSGAKPAHAVCTVLLQQAICPVIRERNTFFNVTKRVKFSKSEIDSVFKPFCRDVSQTSLLSIKNSAKKLVIGEAFALTDEYESCIDAFILVSSSL